ncbi:zinc finger and BTB domain-containing protein 47-like [Microplitis demolitor]|uniref:zinc finger and BTB domain-containing protein 47-like n=1 Tax=Microplitis demolitor TaxID=69319 RepID=UPI00235B5F40|nr:zinc finger and BTB domain-containing protein 47-like [Microplitis demolitor]
MKRFALGDGDVPVVVDLVSDGEEERVRPDDGERDWSDAETVVDETLPPQVERSEGVETPPLPMEVNEGAIGSEEEVEEGSEGDEDSDGSEEDSSEEDVSEEEESSEQEGGDGGEGEEEDVDGGEGMAVAADDDDLSSGSEDDDEVGFVESESSDDSGFRSVYQGSTVDWVDAVEYDGVSSSGDETASSRTASVCSERYGFCVDWAGHRIPRDFGLDSPRSPENPDDRGNSARIMEDQRPPQITPPGVT